MTLFKSLFSVVAVTSLAVPAYAQNCPPPEQFTYTQQANGTYVLTAPEGYSAEPTPVDPNAPLRFFAVYMFGNVDAQNLKFRPVRLCIF